MAKKSIPGTGSSTGRAPSKQVPVAPKPNATGRYGVSPRGSNGMSSTKGGTKGKRGC